ncbi:MATE family efflux transporter [Deinococcus ruber]|uniref:Multidrug export protein MepA n=1 Tax=Deinococcus ruber TaxID=1848197 RepID=A0A918CGX9_9DEIO|nr:MATE family efflux transporter [Deinococcus ruber]GGR23370.1 MATE family efflux transporter [Deinococcus ruber]
MAAASKTERLGTQSIGRLLLEMSSQTTFSLLVYALYTLIDTYFLSVDVGPLAAAGASVIAPVLTALGAVATTVGAGGASVVSRALGEGNVPLASRTVANTFLIFWVVALIIGMLGVILIEPLVRLLGATDRIAPYATEYGRIIFLGAVTSTGFSAIIRADGNARFSTLIWIIPVGVNVALCWLFIVVLKLGAAGAALATVCAQTVSLGMSLYFFFWRKHRSYDVKAAYFRPNAPIIAQVLLIGFPSFAKNFSVSLVAVITNNLLRQLGGEGALSVYAIVGRLYAGLLTPQLGIVQGMQPLVGYNFGQRTFGRVWKTVRLSLRATVLYGVLACGVCLLFSAALLTALSKDHAVLAQGPGALQLLALAFPLTGVSLVVAAAFQAIGRAREALGLTLGGILLVKVPVLLLAAHLFGLHGLWISEAVSEGVLCLTAWVMLKRIWERSEGGLRQRA